MLNKPPGVTSFASLYPVKRTLGKKVGHAGTLDKFAQGLMIVLTGAFTRLNPLFSSMDKRYVATIQFGLETSTLDPEGEIICEKAPCDLPAIEQALKTSFIGTIMQKPPAYSALHIDGKRADTLARRGRYVDIP
ncbi:MAG: tRNA pseudouridine(55) synthase TruB, partial [Sphaerochaetaceae bacterium]|nr:tRNA pseudouridine(55) synthase TruB [Sphaerochaetaceae bacterium]